VGTRTPNRPITSRVRYQLRHAGTPPRGRDTHGNGRLMTTVLVFTPAVGWISRPSAFQATAQGARPS
jgi:hypothetical protein